MLTLRLKLLERAHIQTLLSWASLCIDTLLLNRQYCEAHGIVIMQIIWYMPQTVCAIKSSRRFSTGFRGISRLGSAFIFLRWFKIAHICIQVTSFHFNSLACRCKDWWCVVLREIDFRLKFVIDSLVITPVEWSYLKTVCACHIPMAYAENFHDGGYIHWHMVVICIWCALFVTSQFDFIFMFPNPRF